MKIRLLLFAAILAVVATVGIQPAAQGQVSTDWCDRYDTELCDFYTSDDWCCRAIGPGCGPFVCW